MIMHLPERESQLQTINGTIDGVITGTGAIVMVSGEAGNGKTSFYGKLSPAK